MGKDRLAYRNTFITAQRIKNKMEEEEFNPETHEVNVYSEEGREEYIDGGEISAEEEAFMHGYEDAEEFEEKDEDEKKTDDDTEDSKK